MRVLFSPSNLPFYNLALEETLYRDANIPDTLLLYQNRRCVVIGRNQNPWKEANLPFCKKSKILVARRISGGGAVFQDDGNVNYAFFVRHDGREREKYVALIANVLGCFCVDNVTVNANHSICIGDRKVSGSAFAICGNRAMVHGCILVESNLAMLHDALAGIDGVSFEDASTESVRVPVANISDFYSGATSKMVLKRLEEAAGDINISVAPSPSNELQERFASENWIFGRPERFKVTVPWRGNLKSLEICCGIIQNDNELEGESLTSVLCSI